MTQEDDPTAQHAMQRLLQEIVAAATEEHSGDDLDTVRDALATRIADAGLPQQPEKWVSDTASEISEGRHVVVDRALGHGAGGDD